MIAKTRTTISALALTAITLIGCGRLWHEDDSHQDSPGPTTVFYPQSTDSPHSGDSDLPVCKTVAVSGSGADADNPGYYDSLSYCHERDKQRWLTSCKLDACAKTRVYVHYALADSYPDDMTVDVEAFDNKHFEGSPVAATQIFGFEAKAGEDRQVDMYLQPGQYYFRAYMTNDAGSRVPYVLGDMQVITDHPMGIVGGLSDPKVVIITDSSEATNPPVDLVIDQLLKKPGTEPDTKARLRIELKVANATAVPVGRLVHIQLRNQEDLDAEPVYDEKIASDAFLVQGMDGATEFVSPSLVEGNYTVFVFVDANGNGFADAGELQLLYRELTAVKMIEVRKNTTRTISMELAVPAQ